MQIDFGGLCPSIDKQLREQGYKLPDGEEKLSQKLSESLILLYSKGLITRSCIESAEKKLFKRIREKAVLIKEII